jgi:hypothetical protein
VTETFCRRLLLPAQNGRWIGAIRDATARLSELVDVLRPAHRLIEAADRAAGSTTMQMAT